MSEKSSIQYMCLHTWRACAIETKKKTEKAEIPTAGTNACPPTQPVVLHMGTKPFVPRGREKRSIRPVGRDRLRSFGKLGVVFGLLMARFLLYLIYPRAFYVLQLFRNFIFFRWLHDQQTVLPFNIQSTTFFFIAIASKTLTQVPVLVYKKPSAPERSRRPRTSKLSTYPSSRASRGTG